MSEEVHSPRPGALHFFYTHDFKFSTPNLWLQLHICGRTLHVDTEWAFQMYMYHMFWFSLLADLFLSQPGKWYHDSPRFSSQNSWDLPWLTFVLSHHFWFISKTYQIYPHNKSWINHFSPSLPSSDYPSQRHVFLDDANWLLSNRLLSTQCPTVYAPHSSQTKPLKTKSNHVIPLFRTLQSLPNTLRVKSIVLSKDFSPTDVAFGFLSSLISNYLSPRSHTPVSGSLHLLIPLHGMMPQVHMWLAPCSWTWPPQKGFCWPHI